MLAEVEWGTISQFVAAGATIGAAIWTASSASSVKRLVGPLRAQRQHEALAPFFDQLLECVASVSLFLEIHAFYVKGGGEESWATRVMADDDSLDPIWELASAWSKRVWAIAPSNLQARYPEQVLNQLLQRMAEAQERDPEHHVIIQGTEDPKVLKPALEDLRSTMVGMRDELKKVLYMS